MSAMSGSSGLGSAISSCMDVSSVEMFKDGLHAPFKEIGGGGEAVKQKKKPHTPKNHTPNLPTGCLEKPRDLEHLNPTCPQAASGLAAFKPPANTGPSPRKPNQPPQAISCASLLGRYQGTQFSPGHVMPFDSNP